MTEKGHDSFRARQMRQWVTAAAAGRVLEIGAGTGPNLEHYPSGVSEIVAFDPDGKALRGIDSGNCHVRVSVARAEYLPFADASFDSAVGTLVFCTVADPLWGLREVRRVLKPGAHLRLVEHVSSTNSAVARFQHAVTPAWQVIARGCHLDRSTADTVRRAGFEIRRLDPRFLGILVGIDAVRV